MDHWHRRFAANVKRLAKERDVALTHIPDRAGVGRSAFFYWLNGERSPTLRSMGAVATALNVDLTELLEPLDDE